ncbi:MAG: hypothetical protein ACYTXY_43035, partial [Nostoc sp.]
MAYEVIWKCAQSMHYPAFDQAWHQQEKVKDGCNPSRDAIHRVYIAGII